MIKLNLSTDVLELDPAKSAVVNLQVVNQSQLIDFFTVTMEAVISPEADPLDPTWVTFNLPTFSLRPAQAGKDPVEGDNAQTLIMTVKLPQDVAAGTYVGRIKVAARSGLANSSTVNFNLVISEIEKELMVLDPPKRESRRRTEVFRVKLQNQGNSPRLYSLFAEDGTDSVVYDVQPTEVLLEQGEDTTLTLRARPKQRNWASDPVYHSFNLKIEGLPTLTTGEFIQKAALPILLWFRRAWIRLVIAVTVLIALLTALFIFFIIPMLTPVRLPYCAPASSRVANVLSNDVVTDIFVSDRASFVPTDKVATEDASIMPGIFSSLVSISPDGRRLSYVTASNEALDNARIWVVDLTTATHSRLLMTQIPSGLWPTPPIWSADGETLAYARLKVGTTTATATTTAAASPIPGAAFAPTATPLPQAVNAANPQALEIWTVKPGQKEDLLAGTDKLPKFDVTMFYGDQNAAAPVWCWTSTNDSMIVRSARGTADSNQGQTLVKLSDKSVSKILAPTLPGVPLPTISKVQVGFPLESYLSERFGLKASANAAPAASPPRSVSRFSYDAVSNTRSSLNAPPAGCQITSPFSQNDPLWRDRLLKTGGTARMADTGCALTAAAILMNQFGSTTNTPSSVAECLGEQQAAPLFAQGWQSLTDPRCGSNLGQGGRTDFSWDGLNNALGNGPAIVGLLGGQTGTHFVVVSSGENNNPETYRVTDPWDGSTYKTLDYFLTKGYRLRWLVSYNGQSAPCGGNTASAQPNAPLQIDTKTNAVDGGLFNTPVNFQYTIIGTAISTSGNVRNTGPKNRTTDIKQDPLPPEQQKVFDQDGAYTVVIQATGSPNTSTITNSNVVTEVVKFVVDRTAPTVDVLLNGTAPRQDKYTGSVAITFKAIDELSGIAQIFYRLNDGPDRLFNSDTINQLLTFNKTDIYRITFFAVDGAGNRSDPKTVTFTIELPGTKVTTTPAGGATTTAAAGGNGSGQGGSGAATTAAAPAKTPVPTLPPATTRAATTTAVATTQALSTTVATTAAPVTTTAALVGVLNVSTNALSYNPGTTVVTTTLSNTGTATISYTINLGAAGSLLKVNSTTGTLNPGQSLDVPITLLSPNRTTSTISTSFTISSGTDVRTISVVILPVPVASGVLSIDNITNGNLLLTNIVRVTLNIPSGAPVPDHVDLFVSYSPNFNGAPVTTTLASNLKSTNGTDVTYSWSTVDYPPQSGIIVSGHICLDAAGLNCTDLNAVTGLSVPMSAQISINGGSGLTNPDGTPVITSTATVNVNLSPTLAEGNRAAQLILSWIYTDGTLGSGDIISATNPLTITTSSFSIPFKSGDIIPGHKFQVVGKVCLNPSVCLDITPVINLSTSMLSRTLTGNFGVAGAMVPISSTLNGALLPSQSLTPTVTQYLTVTATGVTTNTNFIRVLATYHAPLSSSQLTTTTVLTINKPVTTTTEWSGTSSWGWTRSTLPAQNDIKLQFEACFNDTTCQDLPPGSLTGITIPPSNPSLLTPVFPFSSSVVQNVTVGTVLSPNMVVKLIDDASNPVPGQTIVFTAPVTAVGPSGFFIDASSPVTSPTYNAITTTAVTDSGGVATAPAYRANANIGMYSISAATSSGGISTTIQLQNNTVGAVQLTVSPSSINPTTVNNAFSTSLVVKAIDGFLNPVSTTITLQAPVFITSNVTPAGFPVPPSTASAVFTNSTSSLVLNTGSSGVVTVTVTANCKVGSYSIIASAPNFINNSFLLTNTLAPAAYFSQTVATTASAPIDTAYPTLAGAVLDDCGNPVPGAPVTLIAPTWVGGTSSTVTGTLGSTASVASVSFSSTLDSKVITTTLIADANGLVTTTAYANNRASTTAVPSFVINAAPGIQPQTAAFTLTNTVGDPWVILPPNATWNLPSLTTTVGTSFGTPLLLVRDRGNNPVPNTTVTFAATSFISPTITIPSAYFGAGGAFTTTATTDTSGQANPGTMTANCAANFQNVGGGVVINQGSLVPNANTHTLTGSVPGVPSVSLTLFNRTDLAADIAVATLTANPLNQSAVVGSSYTNPLKARVTDTCGNSISGSLVRFIVTAGAVDPNGNGSTPSGFPGISGFFVTNTTGEVATAGNYLTANTSIGAFTVRARLVSLILDSTDNYTMTNTAGAAASIAVTGTTTASSSVDAWNGPGSYGIPLQVRVGDQFGNAVSGTVVTYSGPAFDGGTPANVPSIVFTKGISNTTPTTTTTSGANGVAQVGSGSFFPNNKIGTVTSVTANCATCTTTTTINNAWTFTNTVGNTQKINQTAGNNQTARVQQSFATNLAVQVIDQFNNPVDGKTVTFNISGTSANFPGPATSAAVGPTAGGGLISAPQLIATCLPNAGFNVTATAPLATQFVFNEIVKAGDTAASFVYLPGAATSYTGTVATAYTSFPANLQVQVRDSCNNAIDLSGSVNSYSISVVAPAFATNPDGTQTAPSATFSLSNIGVTVPANGLISFGQVSANRKASPTGVTFTFDGTLTGPGGPINVTSPFNFSNVAGPAAVINITGGNNQTVVVTNTFAALDVQVTDVFTNALASQPLTFTRTGANAARGRFTLGPNTPTSFVATTDTSGNATTGAGNLTASCTTAGAFTVQAASGSATATFNLTTQAGPAAAIATGGGGGSSATVNTAYGTALVANITDGCGNAASGPANVTFTAPNFAQVSGPPISDDVASVTFGSIGSNNTTSIVAASGGVAQITTYAANRKAGSVTVTATLGLSNVTYALTNNVGAATNLLVTLPGSTAAANAPTGFGAISTVIADAFGNPRGSGTNTVNMTVTTSYAYPLTSLTTSGNFNNLPGSGVNLTANPASVAGAASVNLFPNCVPGSFTVNVTSGSLAVIPAGPYNFTSNTSVPFQVAAVSGSGQSAQINTAFTNPLVVNVKDACGTNVANGFPVAFTAPASGASLSTTPVNATVAGGVGNASSGTITANGTPGANYNVTVSVGGATATFALTNRATDILTVTTASGLAAASTSTTNRINVPNGSSGTITATVLSSGNPVVGATLSMSSSNTGNGTVTCNAGCVTNGSGQVTATINGVSTGTFTVTVNDQGGTPSQQVFFEVIGVTPNCLTPTSPVSIPTTTSANVTANVKSGGCAGSNVNGANVVFTSGAGGDFGGSSTTNVVTTGSGTVSASLHVSAATGGTVTVTVTVPLLNGDLTGTITVNVT